MTLLHNKLPDNPLFIAMRGATHFLQSIFSTHEAGNYRWSPDPQTTEILITLGEPSTDVILTTRPIVVLARSAANTVSPTIDQAPVYSNREVSHMAELLSFALFINVIDREQVTSETLAIYIRRLIGAYNRELSRLCRFHQVSHVAAISPPSNANSVLSAGELAKWSMTTITLGVSVQDTVVIPKIDPRLFPDSENSAIVNLG